MKYTITKAYPWADDEQYELEISSDNLLYTEMGKTHSGCQVNSDVNQDLIHDKCRQVADLIREIDKLIENK